MLQTTREDVARDQRKPRAVHTVHQHTIWHTSKSGLTYFYDTPVGTLSALSGTDQMSFRLAFYQKITGTGHAIAHVYSGFQHTGIRKPGTNK